MKAVTLLRYQLTGVHDMHMEVVGGLTPDEWTARAHAHGNPLGFLAWHMPATRDWAINTWLQGRPTIRASSSAGKRPGINPAQPPFGMSFEDAGAIAAACTRDDVLAYAADVHEATMAFLDTLDDDALDVVPDTHGHNALVPDKTAAYLDEIDRMYDWPVWRTLAGPCYGHMRGHVEELVAALDAIRA
jgi:hypothetical protein